MGVVICDSSLDSAFPPDIIRPLYQIVCDAWPHVGPLPPSIHEDKISRKLTVKMRPEARRANLQLRLESQHELLDSEGEVVGRIDIFVSCGPREEVYFSFECKRLNILFPSGFKTDADKYCDRGMMRYVTEQYGPGLGRGGMLGYVMDGRCGAAIEAVSNAAATRREELRLQGSDPLSPSAVLAAHHYARDSRHRTATDRPFTIHHLFLAVQSV
jgi:hypothetical protein